MADKPSDVTPPTLTQIWNGPQPLEVGLPSSGQSGGPDTPPPVPPYQVAPGTIEDANAEILGRTQALVDNYSQMKDFINSTKSWIFSVRDAGVIGSWRSVPPVSRGGPVGKMQQPDPNPDATAAGSAASDGLLLQVADAVELAGQYVDVLHHAAQFYTKADGDSVLPAVGAAPAHSDMAPDQGKDSPK